MYQGADHDGDHMGTIDIAKGALQRARNSLLPAPVVFHHVPKCGGTSVGRAIWESRFGQG